MGNTKYRQRRVLSSTDVTENRATPFMWTRLMGACNKVGCTTLFLSAPDSYMEIWIGIGANGYIHRSQH